MTYTIANDGDSHACCAVAVVVFGVFCLEKSLAILTRLILGEIQDIVISILGLATQLANYKMVDKLIRKSTRFIRTRY